MITRHLASHDDLPTCGKIDDDYTIVTMLAEVNCVECISREAFRRDMVRSQERRLRFGNRRKFR